MKIETIKPEYIYLKVIPATSVRNNDSYKIAQAIQSTYKPLLSRFSFHDYRELFNTAFPQLIKYEMPCKPLI